MHVLYDTRLIHPLDRYDYYQAGVNTEIARVEVHGHAPGHLFTAMSVARIGDFEIATHSWSSDSEIVAWRTERSIRACDPECYRIFLLVNGEIRTEQAGNQVDFRLFQGTEPTPMQLVKRLRLQECNRSLRDPALGTKRIKDVIAAHGYGRLDQFSRDFRQMFGVSAREVRGLHSPTGPKDEPRGLEPAPAGTHQDQSRCRRTTMPSQNSLQHWSSDD